MSDDTKCSNLSDFSIPTFLSDFYLGFDHVIVFSLLIETTCSNSRDGTQVVPFSRELGFPN